MPSSSAVAGGRPAERPAERPIRFAFNARPKPLIKHQKPLDLWPICVLAALGVIFRPFLIIKLGNCAFGAHFSSRSGRMFVACGLCNLFLSRRRLAAA